MQTFISHHIINPIQSLFEGFRRIGAAGCALALLAVMSTSALAQSSGQARPYHAEKENFRTLTDFGETWVAPGKATHLGKTVNYGINYWLGFNADGLFYGTGTDTTVAANGDEIRTSFDWTVDIFVPVEDMVVNATYVIVGGTGRFENATGEGTAVGRFNADGNLVFDIEGVINY